MVKEPKGGDLDPRMDVLRDYMLGKTGTMDDSPWGPT